MSHSNVPLPARPTGTMVALAAMPVLRAPAVRPDRRVSTDRPSNLEAYLGQRAGKVNAPGCVHCARGAGIWIECVSVAGYFRESCANCHYGSEGARCSLRFAATAAGPPAGLVGILPAGRLREEARRSLRLATTAAVPTAVPVAVSIAVPTAIPAAIPAAGPAGRPRGRPRGRSRRSYSRGRISDHSSRVSRPVQKPPPARRLVSPAHRARALLSSLYQQIADFHRREAEGPAGEWENDNTSEPAYQESEISADELAPDIDP